MFVFAAMLEFSIVNVLARNKDPKNKVGIVHEW